MEERSRKTKGSNKEKHFKFVFLGDAGVGKTCLCMRITQNKFLNQLPTIGAAYHALKINVPLKPPQSSLYHGSEEYNTYQESETIILDLWDTAG